MDKHLLAKHITRFILNAEKNSEKYKSDQKERKEHVDFYKQYTREKILMLDVEGIHKYLSILWALRMWGNKRYVVDGIVEENSLEKLKTKLAELIWGDNDIKNRWDDFRKNIKGFGPAMMSEILCKTHPESFIIWNKRVLNGLSYLKVKDLPKYNYELTGVRYKSLCETCNNIAKELRNQGFKDSTLLAVDYFIWDELQLDDTDETKDLNNDSEFIHNEVRDQLRDIGLWLGFVAKTEQKVAEGSKVDVVWEATIGNLGRIIYVFEVQAKGSVDKLIINLLKSLNNPAVQGVVAVSDKKQIEDIKKHALAVNTLKDKIKFWDYMEVLKVHENLEFTNSCINTLGLVPQGF